MSEAAAPSHDPAHGSDHGSDALYLKVFGILVICTIVSFVTVTDTFLNMFGEHVGPIVVMVVAVFKATLVAMFFMHLKQDWFRPVIPPYLFLGMMVTCALVMGTILICALLPDQTFSRTRVVEPGLEPRAIEYDPVSGK